MGVDPQLSRCCSGVDTSLLPPGSLVAAFVNLAMVAATQGDGEFVAELASERPVLCKAQVMGIRRAAPTNETGLLGNIFDVLTVAYSAWLR